MHTQPGTQDDESYIPGQTPLEGPGNLQFAEYLPEPVTYDERLHGIQHHTMVTEKVCVCGGGVWGGEEGIKSDEEHQTTYVRATAKALDWVSSQKKITVMNRIARGCIWFVPCVRMATDADRTTAVRVAAPNKRPAMIVFFPSFT